MKRPKKKLLAILFVCFAASFSLFVGILGLSFLGGFVAFGRPIGAEQMERIFVEDYELLETVTRFLVDSGHLSAHIRRSDIANGEIHVFDVGSNVQIEDTNTLEALEELVSRGYSVIVMSDNAIRFQRWSSRDIGHGIVFSIDGNAPELHALTRLEPLPKPSWYYYESNFRVWNSMRE